MSGLKIEHPLDIELKAEDANNTSAVNNSLNFDGIILGAHSSQFFEIPNHHHHHRFSGMNSLTRKEHLPRESFGLDLGELVMMKKESLESSFGGISLNGDLGRTSLPNRISMRSHGRNSDILLGS